MDQGSPTRPTTRKPSTFGLGESRREAAARGDKALLDKAAFLGLLGTLPAQELVDLVAGRLMKRIGELIHSDPEAKAYASILDQLADRAEVARKAVDQLYLRRLNQAREEAGMV
ncbi:MAG: hypothetical protein KKB20_17630 [Proteobacteria bacterium]|nr:hypothetical protein [Pseudomonadota bacterium]